MKDFFKAIAVILGGATVLLAGCSGSHSHEYTLKDTNERYFKAEANCLSGTQYYYSCECGKAGKETFSVGQATPHDFSAEIVSEEYLFRPANCMEGAVYFKSCVTCGQSGYILQTFTYGGVGTCAYTQRNTDIRYLKSEATPDTAAEYYKSCICGAMSEDTFFYGTPLRPLSEEEKLSYQPNSLTVTLYDAENSVYGFTYNTTKQPLRPVLQIQKGNKLTEDCEEFAASVTSAIINAGNNTHYISKITADLEPSCTYTYRIYDKYAKTGSEEVTFETKDTKATAFKFAHVSDSQMGGTSATAFAGSTAGLEKVLSKITGYNDFVLHTGDVVNTAIYEAYWRAMLHDNFQYLSKIPMMPISGNHETTYYGANNAIFHHFHNDIPLQDTKLGYFYSFVYGNTKFIMINTNDSLAGQKDWIIKELQNNDCTWTIVAMHNPMYGVGLWGADPARNGAALELRKQLQGVFAQYGVDLVLQGHDHTIARTYPIDGEGKPQKETLQSENGISYSVNPSGVIYLENGPAGDQTRAPFGTVDSSLYSYASASNPYSWAEFEINGNQMTVSVKYTDGADVNVYQTWGIKKNV